MGPLDGLRPGGGAPGSFDSVWYQRVAVATMLSHGEGIIGYFLVEVKLLILF